MKETITLLENLFCTQTLINAVFSNPRKKEAVNKIIAKPLKINNTLLFQFEVFKNNKALHYNIPIEGLSQFISDNCVDFKQVQIFSLKFDYQILINKKGTEIMKKNPPTKKLTSLDHNKMKNYILNEDTSKEFLIELGIMSKDGQIKPSKYNKYKQINKYLETISSVITDLNQNFYSIVDLGSGKSYLTFAVYHYITNICGKETKIIGVDLKTDVIEFCNELAKKLNYNNLEFIAGDINNFDMENVDIVISLHACNTATDAVLFKAIKWQSKAILAVPCCHNECYTQIKNELLFPILQYGILKEKIASFITDGLRAKLLECIGYNVVVSEFIDMEHTPKNILIKAMSNEFSFNPKIYKEYTQLSNFLELNLTLENLLKQSKII
ncbi:SAM-dependent methyltransferase [Candidatus Epulonipiscium fishelsonii]|uniref:SAM-dependent methyltransferase n=1 Tax=Candidatus Epulonipiscium fishelsonii TaxID=77094 RepID=A0ACC8XIQ7_9FIRM|nr:SAM-dependent methyltransferase [Epulopiscium sp. SCG-D08WGA-EpuloA1]OON90288.1 MAG: SAM-dependent methyltransferase [Epulopiscium sp. AS2M-Bin002]